MRRDSFLGGALILALAGLISRILGAIYRIPLSRLIGDEGIGLFQMAYPIYTIILVFSTVGVPVALSKLVSEKLAKQDRHGASRVFTLSMWILGLAGLVFSLAFVGGAGLASRAMGNPKAYYSMVAIAPAVLVVSIMSGYRGFFQGIQQMRPTAVSQIVEQIVRVITMFFLAYWFLPWGVEYAAAGATFGAVTGALAGLVYLYLVYLGTLPSYYRLPDSGSPGVEKASEIISRVLYLSIPISLAGVVMPVMQLVDAVLVPGRLQQLGFSQAEATALFGQLTGMALPVVALPTIITDALAVSLVPVISEALALNNQALVRSRAATSIRVTMLITLPAVVGMYLLATELSDLLYGAPEAGIPLATLSAGALFLSLQRTTSGILQGMGETNIPVKNLLFGAAWKFGLTWVFTGSAAWGVKGAALATVIGFLLASSLNLLAVLTRLGPILHLGDMVLKPTISVVIMALSVKASYLFFVKETASSHLATLGAVGVGAMAYGLVLLIIGGLTTADFELIPRVGAPLGQFLRRIGLLRE